MPHRTVVLLSLGHLVTDINQGALPALLPFLIAEHHLSYTAAGFLIFACNIASTVVQPIFGHLADRRPNAWLLPAGIVLAGAGLAAVGFVPSYALACAAVMVSGIGVAAFHPQGARFVNRVAGERKATAMSVFGVGGTLGFAIGPGLITAALLHWGLAGTAVLAVPTSLLAVLIARHLVSVPVDAGGSPATLAGKPTADGRDAWGPFARLTAAVVARAILSYGFNTFIPLYWIHVLGQSKAAGATALTVFALAGVAGNLIGGQLADRFGHKRVFLLGTALFTLGSAACAAAPGVGILNAFRVIQAVGAAAVIPASLALVMRAFPRDRLPVAVAIWGAMGAAARANVPRVRGSTQPQSVVWTTA